MTVSLFIGLLLFLLTLYLAISKEHKEIISILIIFLATIKVFIADDIYSCILYSILAIIYGIGLYVIEEEHRTN